MASWNGNPGYSTKNVLSKIWPLALLGTIYGYEYINNKFIKDDAHKVQSVSYTQFVERAKNHEITTITIDDTDALGMAKDPDGKLLATYATQLPKDLNVDEAFKDSNADISIKNSSFWDVLFWIVCGQMLLHGLMETPLKKKILRENGIKEEKSSITFDDVAGIDEIKAEVQEIVSFLKNYKDNDKFGIKTPKGLLLAGAPGNGKTLLARAIAGEAGVPFYFATATEFQNMFYGSSAKQIRDLFAKARKRSPCIIFIDEIDAVGRKRSDRGESAHDSIVVELLSQMDGFEKLNNVLIIAATNKPEVLDPALLRPGRFDRQIVVPAPNIIAREQILRVHSKNRPLDSHVSLSAVAQRTFGFSGADIANLVNEAAITAARRKHAISIMAEDFDAAIDRITMGMKRNLHMTEEQKWITAVHEAGHAIIALAKEKEGAMPLHKVTIAPHGEALGITMMRPDHESYGYKRKELKSQLVVLFGGRIAEEIMLGGPEEIGTGASNDIQKATDIAWQMVTKFGFSALGPIRFGNEHEGYLGPSFGHNLDEHTSARVYEQVSALIREAEAEAREILKSKKNNLERLAIELIAKETLMACEVKSLISPKPA